MSFHAHFLYTDGMREYFVQIVPDVPEILSFAQKEVKIKQSRRAKDAGNQKAVIRHTELQSAERKKKIGYKTEKRNVDRRRYLPCGSDRLILVKNLTGGGGADGENVLYADSVGMITGTGLGTQNRFTGVVEAQDTLKLTLADNQKVKTDLC